MKGKWKLWLVPVLAVVALAAFKGGGLWGKNESPREIPVPKVVVAAAARVKMDHAISLTGNLEAYRQAVIHAKVAGRVSRVAVQNGQPVTAGQPLVQLETSDFANTLAVNEAALKKAAAALAMARADYHRFQELHKQAAVSDKEFEGVTAAWHMAEADAAAAAAAVNAAREALQNATVTSPISGLVANRDVKVGQMVSPQGAPLMTVEDIASVYVVVNIEQQDLARVKPGLKADVTVDAYGDQVFKGVVEVINPVAKQGARVFETKIKVANPEYLLKPGMFARVQLKTGEAVNTLVVPQAALTTKQGMYFVFVPEGNRVKRQQVEIGQIINQSVEIKKGLTEGQQVVITNVNKLKDQDRVEIAR
ncbi:efflux RND transporter periplasmic adaptor subunit [Desulforamulus hydrothermalis]|uniref:Efflux transporter, RND family, MFP subunit n=1 Tax=Desulforamulus hydrothermalis Lam5 = DSM 18033 TaxID=1121428 RepID=K8DXX4_9FIRM|nr:efflux RND transporter periplasmic adaptor subunit [Desulforamulus hydrothermalis]CCO07529.1 Efflux transporter, RND family, MFP subunit [Desulforamulus hydrothermalis Lam5 = DSM 18033]SHH30710.1 RND family efflux transporter, MFP subunit [Desulforamulus hydrothermalis Lam5 = DSM 18033]